MAGPGDDGIPDAFFCPITADYMTDPVVTSDGQTYERAAIERWLDRQRARQLPATSPLTGEALEHTQLVPNVRGAAGPRARPPREAAGAEARVWDRRGVCQPVTAAHTHTILAARMSGSSAGRAAAAASQPLVKV